MNHHFAHLSSRLTEKFDIDPGLIRPEATLADLGLDSLAFVELLMTLQDDWDVDLDESEMPPQTTLAELVAAARTQSVTEAPDTAGT
ncbi:hypothetical protein GCM10009639_35400 [Kitasatospora putterlickiae]|uniref:Carrier domain-containing protein n=1 Tax=Kitasatospora putterlickiae TaxID=221725 RepID=A0ABN1Y6J4_9ACTN